MGRLCRGMPRQRRAAPASRISRRQVTVPFANALGVKEVGEIGVTSTVGAIANAVWHATGVRAWRFPIRIRDLAGLAGVSRRAI
jgi:CO/xanthine dehydrogenase Mo-binding subunit